MGYRLGMPTCLDALMLWRPRRWIAASSMALFSFLALGLSTAVIPNPVFGRGVAVTDWAMPVLIATSVLSGLVFASYIRNDDELALEAADRSSKMGTAGTLLSLFAVGCPTCNKLVLLAVGSSGAVTWFAPLQPYLATAALVLLFASFRTRVMRESSCRLPLR